MSYPASLDTFPVKDEGPGNYLYASDINGITAAIETIETTLGTTPAGTYADLKSAVAYLQSTLAAVKAITDAGGPTGPTGPPGQPRFVGSGPPGAISGAVPGDLYLNESTGQVYTLSE
jgi:hypothetical protein